MFYTAGIPHASTFKALFDEFELDEQLQANKSNGRPCGLRLINEFCSRSDEIKIRAGAGRLNTSLQNIFFQLQQDFQQMISLFKCTTCLSCGLAESSKHQLDNAPFVQSEIPKLSCVI